MRPRVSQPKENRTIADVVLPQSYPPVSLLFVPAHKPRAIEKARALACDMVILDLEDAVPEDAKDTARANAVAAVKQGFPGKRVAVRINTARGTMFKPGVQEHDIEAFDDDARPDFLVLPKVETPTDILHTGVFKSVPLLAMIETPAGVLDARFIAAAERVEGLIAGLNDLAYCLGLPDPDDRSALSHARQAIVIAARASNVWCFDGVFNAIDDGEGFLADVRDGHRLGFDGKTLIHPDQIEPCNAIWQPDEAQLERARALVAAHAGGAERHGDRMIEDMHVAAAERLLARKRDR